MRNLKLKYILLAIALCSIALLVLYENNLNYRDQNPVFTLVSDESTSKLDVYYFYGLGCPHCANVEPLLTKLELTYPIRIQKFDLYSNQSALLTFDEYCNRFNITIENRAIPAIFINSNYFVGDTPILNGLEKTIQTLLENPKTSLRNDTVQEQNILQNSNNLSILTITIAALIDSISPCSIAILAFLIGARVLVVNQKARALKIGLTFCLAMFIAYLLFGLGLFTIIQASGYSSVVSVIIGFFTVFVGVFYLKDVFWHNAGGFTMEVPERLKPSLLKMLKGVRSPIGAFAMGFAVILFELPCTGGPYLFILGQLANNATRLQALPLLIYYNFLFVLPLIIITLFLYSRIFSIRVIREWNERNKNLSRLITGLVAIAMGMLVLPFNLLFQTLASFLIVYNSLVISSLLGTILFLTACLGVFWGKRNKLSVLKLCTVALVFLSSSSAILCPLNIPIVNAQSIPSEENTSSEYIPLPSPMTLSRIQSAFSFDTLENWILNLTYIIFNNGDQEINEVLLVTTLKETVNLDNDLINPNPKPDMQGKTLAFVLPSIPPFGQINASLSIRLHDTDTPTESSQTMNVDTGAHAYGNLITHTVEAIIAPTILKKTLGVGSEYLQSTIDANTNDLYVIQKIGESGCNPVDLFEFVRDEINNEVYSGSLRGARGTLWSKAGNSLDKSNLLIAMLRACGYPSRYRAGVLDMRESRK